jgi:hypothetical protein
LRFTAVRMAPGEAKPRCFAAWAVVMYPAGEGNKEGDSFGATSLSSAASMRATRWRT